MSEAPYAPAEPPADGDRAQPTPPRYSAAASVPVPPQPGPQGPTSFSSAQGPGGASYGSMPGAPYQGGQYGAQPPAGQPPFGQPPVGQPPLGQPPVGSASVPPASGQARVAGAASVPAPSGAGTFGPPPPPPAAFGAAPPPAAYGSAAPPAPGTYGSSAPGTYGAPPAPPAPYGQPPSQFEPARPAGGTYGAPPPAYGPGTFGTPGSPPPSGGEPGYDDPSAPTPGQKPRKGLIIALGILAAVIVAGGGAYVGLSAMKGGPEYTVDKCVQREGDSAALADCSVEGAYRIVSVVDSQTQCEDARQPWLEVTEANGSKSYRCLVPVTPPQDTEATPTATATP